MMRHVLQSRYLKLGAFGIGVLLLGYTISGLFRNREFLVHAAQADASVVAFRKLEGQPDVPVIRFNADDGSVITWVAINQPTHGLDAVGKHTKVLYRADQPGAVMIGSFFIVLTELMSPGLIGLALIAFGRSVLSSRVR